MMCGVPRGRCTSPEHLSSMDSMRVEVVGVLVILNILFGAAAIAQLLDFAIRAKTLMRRPDTCSRTRNGRRHRGS